MLSIMPFIRFILITIYLVIKYKFSHMPFYKKICKIETWLTMKKGKLDQEFISVITPHKTVTNDGRHAHINMYEHI